MGIFVQSTVNLLSDNAAVAITVTPSNPGNPGNPGNPTANAPVITAPVSVSVSSTGGYNFGGTISLSDSIVGVEQFSMTVQHGTLTLGTTTGLTISGNGNATVIMSGSLQAINAGLASLHYQPTSGYNGADKLSMYVVNATSNLSASSAVTLNVSPSGGTGPGGNTNTNGAPAISAPSAANVPQDTTFAFTGPNAISVSDPVNGIEQFSIVVNHGILNFGSTTGMTVSGNSSRIVILSGTLANLNAALTTLTYTPTTGYVGGDNLTMTDQNSSNNLATSAAIALTVGGSNSNASPSLLGPASAVINSGNSILGSTGISGITLTDPTTGIEQLSLAVQNGVLNVTPIPGVITSGNGTGTLLLSGTASDLNTVLNTLTYTPAVGNLSNTDNLGVFVQNTTSNLTSDLGIPLNLL